MLPLQADPDYNPFYDNPSFFAADPDVQAILESRVGQYGGQADRHDGVDQYLLHDDGVSDPMPLPTPNELVLGEPMLTAVDTPRKRGSSMQRDPTENLYFNWTIIKDIEKRCKVIRWKKKKIKILNGDSIPTKYERRQVYAKKRPRVNGRFMSVKSQQTTTTPEQATSS
ncbi:CCT domain-containing protein [Plasmodiophora brassicae]